MTTRTTPSVALLGSRGLLAAIALSAVALSGCIGAPDERGATSGLVELDTSTPPLGRIDSDAWRRAPAGCEDRLAAGLSFRLASALDGLVAAVDGEGQIVCVDTVESVQEELAEEGREDEADELGDRYLLAVALAVMPSSDSMRAGDPSPQPSVLAHAPGNGGIANGDPSPQPSSQP
jgi:hypothetical protein